MFGNIRCSSEYNELRSADVSVTSKNGGKLFQNMSQNKKSETITVVEIQHVQIIGTTDPVKGQSFLSRKCEKSKFLVSYFLSHYRSTGKMTPKFCCHSFIFSFSLSFRRGSDLNDVSTLVLALNVITYLAAIKIIKIQLNR